MIRNKITVFEPTVIHRRKRIYRDGCGLLVVFFVICGRCFTSTQTNKKYQHKNQYFSHSVSFHIFSKIQKRTYGIYCHGAPKAFLSYESRRTFVKCTTLITFFFHKVTSVCFLLRPYYTIRFIFRQYCIVQKFTHAFATHYTKRAINDRPYGKKLLSERRGVFTIFSQKATKACFRDRTFYKESL